MTDYYRPIAQVGDMPDGANRLAGGICWFDQALVRDRAGRAERVPADELPPDVLSRLITPRLPVCGMLLDRPLIMSILNVTPDSFSDGGRYDNHDTAVAHAMQMVCEGADIIDIGGESTRPGAAEVSVSEETERTAPVIAALRAKTDVPISIDTRKATVAKEAVAAGADMINDVAAMTFDLDMSEVMAVSGLPVCLMHAQGDPATMQADPRYDDVVLDVYDFLAKRVATAEAEGISRDRIIIDPGIGFGKTVEHNLALLQEIAIFHSLGCPILLGASRKRFIGAVGGGESAMDRLGGSVAVALHGLRQGVQITRVHDTFATKQAFDLEQAINRAE